MRKLFTQDHVREYAFEEVPLNEEIWLMDAKWMSEYDRVLNSLTNVFDVGYISKAIARSANESSIELSWFLTDYRFHEIRVTLPREVFFTCIDCPGYDLRPRVFVDGSWLTSLHLRIHSVYAIFDAIGVKESLLNGTLTRESLISLREHIDRIASDFRNISFVSFADSLLLKSNWSVGQYDSAVRYTYEPEAFIRIFPLIQEAYANALGMKIYAVLTQGINEYYDDSLLHISSTKNHVSLNSLGLPFAQLLAIDRAAREAIKAGTHAPKDLYMDGTFYHSLRFDYPRFDKNARPRYSYQPPIGTTSSYYFSENHNEILNNLKVLIGS